MTRYVQVGRKRSSRHHRVRRQALRACRRAVARIERLLVRSILGAGTDDQLAADREQMRDHVVGSLELANGWTRSERQSRMRELERSET